MTQATATSPPTVNLSRLHWLLGVQSVVIVLLSINRLSTLALGYVHPNEFLRWVDLNNMLILPVVSLLALYLLKKQMEAAGGKAGRRWGLALNLAFILGAYLLGASYGDHEVTNYLHARFCPEGDSSALCRIVMFNDDEFSHWVFFTGFVLVNGALMLLQVVYPHPGALRGVDWALVIFNGFFIGAGVFANLAFEEIGLDLYIVALLAILAALLIWRRGPQPLLVYYATAYWLGLVGTLIYTNL